MFERNKLIDKYGNYLIFTVLDKDNLSNRYYSAYIGITKHENVNLEPVFSKLGVYPWKINKMTMRRKD